MPLHPIYNKVKKIFALESENDRIDLAKDPKTPPEKLLELVKDKTSFATARICIAYRPDINAEIIDLLVNDPNPIVRSAISKSRNIPISQLRKLSADPEYSVSSCAKDILCPS